MMLSGDDGEIKGFEVRMTQRTPSPYLGIFSRSHVLRIENIIRHFTFG
jgi:hypothetical protein